MKKQLYVLLLVAFSFFTLFVYSTHAAIFEFTKDLKKGDKNSDVKLLQEVLNKDEDTQVAKEGSGSPGNETNYFGEATKKAVIKFQDKYAAEVLYPAGLTEGTGYVGLLTRKKLNEILKNIPGLGDTSIITTSLNQAAQAIGIAETKNDEAEEKDKKENPDLKITKLSREDPAQSEDIEVEGTGFRPKKEGMHVYISTGNGLTKQELTFDFKSEKKIKVQIPDPDEVVPAIYLLYAQIDGSKKDDTRNNSPKFIMIIPEDAKILRKFKNDIDKSIDKVKEFNSKVENKIEDDTSFNTPSEGKFSRLAFFLGKIVETIKYTFSIPRVFAQANHNYFGGSIQQVTYCTCFYDFGVILRIKDLSRNGETITTAWVAYQSRLRPNYNIWKSGPNVIGGYNQQKWQCKQTVYYQCVNTGQSSDSVIDMIRGIGTSEE